MIQEPRITKLQSLIDQGNNLITTNKGKDAAAGIWKSMAARESFSGGSGIAGEKTAFGALRDAQASSYNTAVGQKMSFAAAAAGAAIIAAAEAPSEFVSRVARESTDPKFANYMAVANDNSLSLDYGRDPWTSSKVAQEYYSDKDLDKNLGLSWALNVRALETQSKFAETLYPTITVETNDVGITIRTKVTCVTRGLLNALLQKDSVEDDRQPLQWAPRCWPLCRIIWLSQTPKSVSQSGLLRTCLAWFARWQVKSKPVSVLCRLKITSASS